MPKESVKASVIEFRWSVSAARLLTPKGKVPSTKTVGPLPPLGTRRTPRSRENLFSSSPLALPVVQPVRRRKLFQENNGRVNPLLLNYSQLIRSPQPAPSTRLPPHPTHQPSRSDLISTISLSSESSFQSQEKLLSPASKKSKEKQKIFRLTTTSTGFLPQPATKT